MTKAKSRDEYWDRPAGMNLTGDQICRLADDPESAAKPEELRLIRILAGQGHACTPDEKEAESCALDHIAYRELENDPWRDLCYQGSNLEKDLEYERRAKLNREELMGPLEWAEEAKYSYYDGEFDPDARENKYVKALRKYDKFCDEKDYSSDK